MLDDCWRASHYGMVHAALRASLDSPVRNVAPGTHGAVGRALDHFHAAAQADRVVALRRISLTIVELQGALRNSDDDLVARTRAALSRQARAWLLDAPMFPPAASGTGIVRAA